MKRELSTFTVVMERKLISEKHMLGQNFRVQDHRGVSVFYLDTPLSSPNLQVLPAAQSEELFLRRQSARLGRVGGGHPVIVCSPLEAGRQLRFTVADGGGQPWTQLEPEGRQRKARAGARGNRVVGKGLVNSIEERRGYVDVTWREARGGVR